MGRDRANKSLIKLALYSSPIAHIIACHSLVTMSSLLMPSPPNFLRRDLLAKDIKNHTREGIRRSFTDLKYYVVFGLLFEERCMAEGSVFWCLWSYIKIKEGFLVLYLIVSGRRPVSVSCVYGTV